MRILGVVGTSVLLLLLMVAAPAYSQDRDDNKPQAQEAPKPQDNRAARPDNRAPQDDRARQDQKTPQKEQQDQAKEHNRAPQEQDRNMRAQQRDQHPVDNRPADNRQDNRRMDNRQMENRPADNRQGMGRDENRREAADRGRHIPDDQFRAHFGREHRFHVQRDRVINVSQPVVVYGGYSFELVDPWPADWSYDDDCYIDYVDDGYYLFDVMHPGMRIAVFVVE